MQEATQGAARDGSEAALESTEPADPALRQVRIHREMVRARLVSARMALLQRTGKIASHAASVGQEGVIVAAALAVRGGDFVFPGRRDWAAGLARGASLLAYFHHAFGSADDPAKGHSAPDHLPARSVKVVPPSGVVGAHLVQAAGCAWAARVRRDDVAVLALFGDGASSAGDFHNAMNFAGVFKAPVVFVSRDAGDADKAVAYGIANAKVDGRDALAVDAIVRAAFARVFEGKGPTLIEAPAPSLGADLRDEDLASTRVLDLGQDDPIVRLRLTLTQSGRFDASAEEAHVSAVLAEIERGVAAAERAGPPPTASLFEHVYATVPSHLALQLRDSEASR